MPYIIDGHNLIPHVPGIDLRDIDDELRLVEVLQSFARRVGKDIEVYFDGASSSGSQPSVRGRVRAIFVARGRSADQAIAQRLRRLGGEAKNWQVVSSDHEVQRSAAEAGAGWIDSPSFARDLEVSANVLPADGADPEITPDEVQEWLDRFKKKDRPDS